MFPWVIGQEFVFVFVLMQFNMIYYTMVQSTQIHNNVMQCCVLQGSAEHICAVSKCIILQQTGFSVWHVLLYCMIVHYNAMLF